ncbi:MAG: hypothetical protein WEE89_14365 [Gemmatimonadota bacterium]
MRKLTISSLVAVVITLHAAAASAQACLGLPSFVNGSVHANVAVFQLTDSVQSVAVGLGAGRPNHLFANIGGAQVTYEGFDEKSTLGFLEFGYQIPVSRLQLCPIAGGYLAAGPDDGLMKITSRVASAGLAAGLPITMGSFRIIPNAAFKYDYESTKFVEEGFEDETITSNSQGIDLGLGFVFADRFGLQPIVHLPLSSSDSDPSFGIFASVSFGWRAK